jgi:tetratricopeptide (TPR) repeat protein
MAQLEQAAKLYEQALTIARETNDRRREAEWLGFLGRVYSNLGQFERAIRLHEQALAISREIGDRRHEVIWLNNLGNVHCTLGQVERAIKLYEEALVITREIGYRLGESYQLLGLCKALLVKGEFLEAVRRSTEALALKVPGTSYQAALMLGIVLLHQRNLAAKETFADAITRCQALLDKTVSLYAPRYALATALVGHTVCDSRWKQEKERAELLVPVLTEYQRALENCNAPGVVGDALRDLELIRAAGVEGLEPVFELLEGALPELG